MTCASAKKLALLRARNFRQKARIIELERENAQLKALVYTDQLTGLYNQNFYCRRVLPEFVSLDKKVAVIMIDLNGFKQLNDQYGHLAGDMGLVAVAQILESSIRVGDYAIRLGGDEFLIVLPRIRADDELACKRICQKIGERISQIQLEQAPSCQLLASWGYAVRANKEELLALVKKADERMLAAKPTNARATVNSLLAA